MAQNLVTRAEYKTYAEIKSTNYDSEIDALIPRVSELVESYCRKTFVDYIDEIKSEVFDGGTKILYLKETPVTNILSVEFSDDYGQTYSELTQYTDWVAKDDKVISTATSKVFKEYILGYRVSYYAGYETLPADLGLAVMDLITYYRKNDSAIHSNKSPGTNSVQIEYISTTSLPANIRRVLDLYVADYT